MISISREFFEFAEKIRYNPSEISDWDDTPIDISVAIDELASRIRDIEIVLEIKNNIGS